MAYQAVPASPPASDAAQNPAATSPASASQMPDDQMMALVTAAINSGDPKALQALVGMLSSSQSEAAAAMLAQVQGKLAEVEKNTGQPTVAAAGANPDGTGAMVATKDGMAAASTDGQQPIAVAANKTCVSAAGVDPETNTIGAASIGGAGLSKLNPSGNGETSMADRVTEARYNQEIKKNAPFGR
jgi:hypothetical protein